ncbi:MAG: sigma-70 family RNA polymerase sigma factor [Planctomycetota bacterium]|nr:sigma-70 family RNA polymerase sigma factor [Planctomycetota bacterium]
MRTLSDHRGEAVEALVRTHQGAVRGYLVVLGCPPHLVDDLVQEVFLAVLRSPFEDRGRTSTSAWLRTVARNLFLKAMSRERRQPPAGDLALAEAAWEEFERDDGGESYIAALRSCMAGLKEDVRTALELRYRERMRRSAIAHQLGLSEAGVKSILVRAKKRLRACIERKLAA